MTEATGDQKFWRLSYEIQIRLGKSHDEAKAHADAYAAKLKEADGESNG